MSAKKFDLAKNLGLKIAGRMNAAGVPDRFAQAAADATDKREQRKRDAAAGLVPFACKLPSALTAELQQLAATHEGGINDLVAGLLSEALKKKPKAEAKAEPKAKPAAEEASDAEAEKKPAAKKTAAKKTAAKKSA
jgi:hypothetical protein